MVGQVLRRGAREDFRAGRQSSLTQDTYSSGARKNGLVGRRSRHGRLRRKRILMSGDGGGGFASGVDERCLYKLVMAWWPDFGGNRNESNECMKQGWSSP